MKIFLWHMKWQTIAIFWVYHKTFYNVDSQTVLLQRGCLIFYKNPFQRQQIIFASGTAMSHIYDINHVTHIMWHKHNVTYIVIYTIWPTQCDLHNKMFTISLLYQCDPLTKVFGTQRQSDGDCHSYTHLRQRGSQFCQYVWPRIFSNRKWTFLHHSRTNQICVWSHGYF